jgi:hypothetical protein
VRVGGRAVAATKLTPLCAFFVRGGADNEGLRHFLFENVSLSSTGTPGRTGQAATAGPTFRLSPTEATRMDGSRALRQKKLQAGFTLRTAVDQRANGWRDSTAVRTMRAAAKRVAQAGRGEGEGRTTGSLQEMGQHLQSRDAIFQDIVRVKFDARLRRWSLSAYMQRQRFEMYFINQIRALVPAKVWGPDSRVTPVLLVGDGAYRSKGFQRASCRGPRPRTNSLIRLAARALRMVLLDEFRSTRLCLYCGRDNGYAQKKTKDGRLVKNPGVMICKGSALCRNPTSRDRKSARATLAMWLAQLQEPSATGQPVVGRIGGFSRAAKLPWANDRSLWNNGFDNFTYRCGGAAQGGNDDAPASNPGFHPLFVALQKHTVRGMTGMWTQGERKAVTPNHCSRVGGMAD